MRRASQVHERSHTGDRPFKCGCGKAFATGYGLKSHTRVHTGEKPYKCPEETCDKAFKTSGDLQKHVRTHTGTREGGGAYAMDVPVSSRGDVLDGRPRVVTAELTACVGGATLFSIWDANLKMPGCC